MPAKPYNKQVDENNILLLRDILSELPQYATIAFRGIENTTSTRTRLGYARDIKTFYEYLCENNPFFRDKTPLDITTEDLSRLEAEDIEEFLHAMKLYTKNGRTYTNGEQALKRKLSALRVFFAYLYKNDRISSNAAEKVDMPKIHDKKIIRMEPNEVADFLDNVEYGSGLTERQKNIMRKIKSVTWRFYHLCSAPACVYPNALELIYVTLISIICGLRSFEKVARRHTYTSVMRQVKLCLNILMKGKN